MPCGWRLSPRSSNGSPSLHIIGPIQLKPLSVLNSSPPRVPTRSPLAGHRIIVASRYHPYFLKSGTGTYISAIIDGLLAAGATVRLLVTEPPPELSNQLLVPDPLSTHDRLTARIDGSIRLHGYLLSTRGVTHKVKSWAQRAVNKVERLVTGAPPHPPCLDLKWPAWDEALRLPEARFLKREVAVFRPHSILLNYSWLAPFTAHLPVGPSRPKSFMLTHDVRHQDCVQSPHGMVFRENCAYSKEREISELIQVDTVVAIQPREARHFKAMLPGKDVITMYPPIALVGSVCRQPVLGRCLLVGSNNAANGEGARWFLDQVWPLVMAGMHEAHLRICGDVGKHALLASIPPSVVICGRVSNLNVEYSKTSVVAAPLLFGSGIKLKVIEAMSHGCAVVGTSVAMDGVEPLPSMLIGYDQPELFAKKILGLLKDTEARKQAEKAALTLAKEQFSVEACLAPLVKQLLSAYPASCE